VVDEPKLPQEKRVEIMAVVVQEAGGVLPAAAEGLMALLFLNGDIDESTYFYN
jgi:hypothetical protein